MTPEHFAEVLKLCEASPPNSAGMREMPEKITITLYAACNSVALTISSVAAVAVEQQLLRARTTKGDLYVLALQDVFSASITGGTGETRAPRRAGFA